MSRTLMLIAGLLFASTMLSGCIVEEPGHPHWWAWHHHDDR